MIPGHRADTEFVWAQDEGAFAPVADPADAAGLDTRAPFRRTLGE